MPPKVVAKKESKKEEKKVFNPDDYAKPGLPRE
jgi:hypothetical protein